MKRILILMLMLSVLSLSSCDFLSEEYNPYEGLYLLEEDEQLTCKDYNTTELYILQVLSETDDVVVVGTEETDRKNTNGVKYFWHIKVGNCNFEITNRASYAINKFLVENFDVTIIRYNLSESERVLGYKGKITL